MRNAHVHPMFAGILNSFSPLVPLQKFMVQVWDNGKWSDYWPTDAGNAKEARAKARQQILAPFWRAKRWRVIEIANS